METNPWWKPLVGQSLPSWNGPVGVKPDGGGSIRGCGRIGSMQLHRAACNRDASRESVPSLACRRAAALAWAWAL